MLAKLSTAAILAAGIAFAATPSLEAEERAAPVIEELRAALARDAATAGVELRNHSCTERSSRLFGTRTYACRLEIVRDETPETVTRIITAFDGGWAVAGR